MVTKLRRSVHPFGDMQPAQPQHAKRERSQWSDVKR